MNITIRIQSEIQPQTEALIIPFWQGDDLSAQLSQLAARFGVPEAALQTDFKAEAKETLPLYPSAGAGNLQKVFLLGMGKTTGAGETPKGFRQFFHRHKSRLPRHVAIDFTRTENPALHLLEAAATGALTGGYNLALYKTEQNGKSAFFTETATLDFLVSENDRNVAETAVRRGQATAETQLRIMDLGNAPSNYKNPQTLAVWAVESGQRFGYGVQVFDKQQLTEMGVHALLAVNKGSASPPALIVLEYKPANATGPKVGLVGKGVTFDTGGISIKDSNNMHLMKSDMGGAAAVLGTVELAAKLQLPVHVVGVIPATENSVDGESTKPGDVIGSYAGKTIEVIDTDAEGRLILADALAYIVRNHQPDVLIDLATLTGSVIGTLGYVAAGLFTANDDLAAALLHTGEATGEKLWRLPLWDDYKDDLKSDVADVKNYHGKPFAGAIMGAKFLEVFTDKHPAWAHLDIAGTAFNDSEFGSQKNATAYGVRLLTTYLSKLTGT